MLPKWHNILINWVNCYFDDNIKEEHAINLETLHSIINQLRENLSLDESKSSILDAHTVEEFILKKYPNFKFENGSTVPNNDDEIYIAASLLLFFVCVASKDVDIKKAMCRKLTSEDQETILKFSKCLMECTEICYKDVKAAILESSGQDIAAGENTVTRTTVAETPPALRSLHSEVRRLQAALDAERFDRNYLQEELARSNLRLEKLLKDKEQYKLDILNLKGKLSLCCGQDTEKNGGDATTDSTARLAKQLQDLEERLITTQEQLDDALEQRDTYKTKIIDLKQERNKWLSLSQQESARVNQLTEELETERRHVHSLRELVADLRQHHQKNCLDSSQLECDDPDTSIQSLRNTSFCNEACANVIEIQLVEEKAKVALLNRQIQTLQDQVNELLRKGENEKQNLEGIILEKDNDILNLKHRINEEIDEKNILKSNYNDHLIKLNNEINELEQKLKDTNESLNLVIVQQKQHIQILQEDKLSLTETLSGKTTELENIITDLRAGIDTEKNLKLKMKDDYEKQFMKLNEKILNRNNELVDMQNKIFKNGEDIEQLHFELRKEKDFRQELDNRYHANLEQLKEENINIEINLRKKIEELNKEADKSKEIIEIKLDECKILKETKESLLNDIQSRDTELQNVYKELESTKHMHLEEVSNFISSLEEKGTLIKSLQVQLEDEMENKGKLLNDLTHLQETKINLSEEISHLRQDIHEKDRTIYAIDLYLKEEKHNNKNLKLDNNKISEELQKLKEVLLEKDAELQASHTKYDNYQKFFQEELHKKDEFIESITDKLTSEILEKNNTADYLATLKIECDKQTLDLQQHLATNVRMLEDLHEKEDAINVLENTLAAEVSEKKSLEKALNSLVEAKDNEIATLTNVIQNNDNDIKKLKEVDLKKQDIIETINKHLSIETAERNTLESCLISMREERDRSVKELQDKLISNKYLSEELCEKQMLIESLNERLLFETKEKETMKSTISSKDHIINELQYKLENSSKEFEQELYNKVHTFESLQKEMTSLVAEHNALKENKNKEIKSLQDKLESNSKSFEEILHKNEELIKSTNHKLSTEMSERNALEHTLLSLQNDKKAYLKCMKDIQILKEELCNKDQLIQSTNAKLAAEIAERKATEDALQSLKIQNEEELRVKQDYFKESLRKQDEVLRSINDELLCHITENNSLKDALLNVKNNEITLRNELASLKMEKETEIKDMQNKLERCKNTIQDQLIDNNNKLSIKDKELESTRENVQREIEHKMALQKSLELLKEEKADIDSKLNTKCLEILQLQTENDRLSHVIETNNTHHEELNVQLSNLVSSGLHTVLESINNENVTSEVLQRLILEGQSEITTIEEKCKLLINITETLTLELSMKSEFEKALQQENASLYEIEDKLKERESELRKLEVELNSLQQSLRDNKEELTRQRDTHKVILESKLWEIQQLQKEYEYTKNELTDVKVQLEVKVHSLNEKLVDSENLIDNLKATYECQIDSLNVMVTKLTSYLKENTIEIDVLKKERDVLQQLIKDNNGVIQSLEDEVKLQKQEQEKLIGDYESEILVLKNMVTVTESVMDDQRVSLNKVISEYMLNNDTLQKENKNLQELVAAEIKNGELKIEKDALASESVFKELAEVRNEKNSLQIEKEMLQRSFAKEIKKIKKNMNLKKSYIKKLEISKNRQLRERARIKCQMENKLKVLTVELFNLVKEKSVLKDERDEYLSKLNVLMAEKEEIDKLKLENAHLVKLIEDNKSVINGFDEIIKEKLEENNKTCEDAVNEKLKLENKCSLLEECHAKAEEKLLEREKEINDLKTEVNDIISHWTSTVNLEKFKVNGLEKELDILKTKLSNNEEDLKENSERILKMTQEKDLAISTVQKELKEEEEIKNKYQRELELKAATVYELRQKLEEANNEVKDLLVLKKENEDLLEAVRQQEILAISTKEMSCQTEEDLHSHQQVGTPISDTNSLDSLRTITDLQKTIHDKNETIITLQSEITYIKTLVADSENKLLDVNNELQITKENCEQLSNQLKKIVQLKNEEISDLKKQISKMSVTENRASQIIKVSSKYQAIILKRIAEIKTNTVLKELTNFGNSNNCDNELRRSLNSGAVTMEDLENFLETTDKHLRRCSEKQLAIQKEKNRLTEIVKMHETEILNLKLCLSDLSVSFKTFNTVREVYAQKLCRVVSIQRTVRREILNLEGTITDAMMCKLERAYAAVMQDLSECAMNLERWMERCIGKTISTEQIKQACSGSDGQSVVTSDFQNAGLEGQLQELEKSFGKLLEEVKRALKGEGAKDVQAMTVMEVRAEYEDKLNRMKAKMKQLYQEQISVFKEKQKDEIGVLERELQYTRDKLSESSRAYEQHIRSLTTELWGVSEKYLVKKDEAEWLRKKQQSGSLMSLQHVHSSGLAPHHDTHVRTSDAHSLRSLPITNAREKRDGRGVHMSDEEGETFDNRWLKELSTPRRDRHNLRDSAVPPEERLSELRWRNSLCPPHLKSSYPAETQFTHTFDEEDIKFAGIMPNGGKQQRKEVGITAYKKPGPPTPSKQAGRLSATDSDLRESLRVDTEPHSSRRAATPGRKPVSTPSRIRAFFRPSKPDNIDGTPRTKRLSNYFRKK